MKRLDAARVLRRITKVIGGRPGFVSMGMGGPDIMDVILVITIEEQHKDAYKDLPVLLEGVPYEVVYGERPKAL